jgi:hypothetical protein
MNSTNEITPAEKASPITNFVITLGKELLKQKVKDWLDMEGVARFCKEHSIELNGQCAGSEELETKLKRFFEPTGECYGPDVNVDGYERPNEWDRPFMIRAFPYSPNQPCSSVDLAELDAAAPVTACSD